MLILYKKHKRTLLNQDGVGLYASIRLIMKLYIKNMVCSSRKMVVKSVFENIGINPIAVELGEVELKNDIKEVQKQELLKNLRAIGFDLIDDNNSFVNSLEEVAENNSSSIGT